METDQVLNSITEYNNVGIEVIIDKEIKKFGTSGHVYMPKRYVGRKVRVIILKDKVIENGL